MVAWRSSREPSRKLPIVALVLGCYMSANTHGRCQNWTTRPLKRRMWWRRALVIFSALHRTEFWWNQQLLRVARWTSPCAALHILKQITLQVSGVLLFPTWCACCIVIPVKDFGRVYLWSINEPCTGCRGHLQNRRSSKGNLAEYRVNTSVFRTWNRSKIGWTNHTPAPVTIIYTGTDYEGVHNKCE